MLLQQLGGSHGGAARLTGAAADCVLSYHSVCIDYISGWATAT